VVGEDFPSFFADTEPRLRRAFTSLYGRERGADATAEALAYAWEHWERVRIMERPLGYLFRVGQTRTRRVHMTPRDAFPEREAASPPWIEPGLPHALASLSRHQRVTVVLVHGFEWQLREVADLLAVKVTTVQNHLERGLAKLRRDLEVSDD
jgi:DNA-directed RNA polymerase specialized sigma24 family protein